MRRARNLGVFSAAEERKLIAALSVNPVPELRARILWECSEFARISADHEAGYARDQRRDHARARKIEKLAKQIVRLAGDDIGWCAIVKPAHELQDIGIRLRGAPRKLGLPCGAVDLALSFLLAEGIRGKERIEIPRSRSGPLADVLRIVYRIRDPMPIVEEIIADRARRPGPSTLRLVGKSRPK